MIPVNEYVPTHRMYSILATYRQIRDGFGFDANVRDEYSKVHQSWIGENECGLVAVWSWKEAEDPAEHPDNEIEWSAWASNSRALDQFLHESGARR
jgi:hypothetical protein